MAKYTSTITLKPIFYACLLTLIAYLWTSFTSDYLVVRWGWDIEKITPAPMWIAQIISVPLLGGLLFILMQIGALRAYRSKWFIIFLAYLFIYTALFFSVAPGCFTEDSFYTMHMVRNGWWEGWYSSLHPALMTALIQIIPWDSNAPGIFLAILWASVYTGFHFLLSNLKAHWLLHVLIIPLVLAPAQLASFLIIVRDSFFTAIFIIYLGIIFYLLSVKRTLKKRDLFVTSLIGAFLSFYRTDAFPAVIIGQVVCWYYFKRRSDKRLGVGVAFTLISPFLFFCLFSILPSAILKRSWVKGNTWGNRAELEYKLTLIENPLGYIVRNHGFISNEQKMDIEKVYAIEDLKEKWCPQNICLFYGGHWNKSSSRKERDAAFKASLAVFLHNPGLFIAARYETLKTVGDNNTQTVCSGRLMQERGYPKLFDKSAYAALGQGLSSLMKATETAGGLWGGKNVWWNFYASSLVLFFILAFYRITPAASLVSLILLARTAIVVLTAPAGFSVYYTVLFLGAPFLSILWFGEIFYNKVRVRKLPDRPGR